MSGKIMFYLALIFIGLGGLGAIMLAIFQFNSSKSDKGEIISSHTNEVKSLNDQLEILKNQRDSLQKDLGRLGEQLGERDSVLSAKDDEILELNKELRIKSDVITKMVIGGDEPPIVRLEYFPAKRGDDLYGLFTVKTDSKFPYYNMHIVVTDYEKQRSKLQKKPFSNYPVISKKDQDECVLSNTVVEELSSYRQYTLPPEVLLKEASYHIKLTSRSMSFVQKYVIISWLGKLIQSIQVFDLKGNVLVEDIPNYLPDEIKESIMLKLEEIEVNPKISVIR